jgi:FtsH-binding integral membrane protein
MWNSIVKEFNKLDVSNIVSRALKTFAQSFITFLTLSGFGLADLQNWAVGNKLLIAAVIGAATVVWNTVVVPLWNPVAVKLGFKSPVK